MQLCQEHFGTENTVKAELPLAVVSQLLCWSRKLHMDSSESISEYCIHSKHQELFLVSLVHFSDEIDWLGREMGHETLRLF